MRWTGIGPKCGGLKYRGGFRSYIHPTLCFRRSRNGNNRQRQFQSQSMKRVFQVPSRFAAGIGLNGKTRIGMEKSDSAIDPVAFLTARAGPLVTRLSASAQQFPTR